MYIYTCKYQFHFFRTHLHINKPGPSPRSFLEKTPQVPIAASFRGVLPRFCVPCVWRFATLGFQRCASCSTTVGLQAIAAAGASGTARSAKGGTLGGALVEFCWDGGSDDDDDDDQQNEA